MPELPEVETVRRGLQPALEGARIVRVEARRPDLRFPLPDRFAARLEGKRVEALGRRGAQLRTVELIRPRSVIAKNTVEALLSGMVFGMAAQVEGIVARMVAALDAEPSQVRVISTGYLADIVEGVCDCFTDHCPWLTLLGLELIFRRNS